MPSTTAARAAAAAAGACGAASAAGAFVGAAQGPAAGAAPARLRQRGAGTRGPQQQPQWRREQAPASSSAPALGAACAVAACAGAGARGRRSRVGRRAGAADVKALRERSRAGILDCKKALSEVDGDMEKAMEWLKKRGIAKADKKAGNAAVEGNIASYVHFNSKLAVMVEVNSETDFVASNAIFKEFAADVAMQIAANPTVTCVTADDVPEDVKAKEKEAEMNKEDLVGKPDDIKEKIGGARPCRGAAQSGKG